MRRRNRLRRRRGGPAGRAQLARRPGQPRQQRDQSHATRHLDRLLILAELLPTPELVPPGRELAARPRGLELLHEPVACRAQRVAEALHLAHAGKVLGGG